MMLIENPETIVMEQLIRHAHIHLLITFKATGLKLKLLKSIFSGRFCLVNEAMVAGTDLGQFCQFAASPDEFRKEVIRLFSIPFDEHEVNRREKKLLANFSDANNCKRITELISL
jgi:hypothetical protein